MAELTRAPIPIGFDNDCPPPGAHCYQIPGFHGWGEGRITPMGAAAFPVLSFGV
jgi:hypothetical protein